MPSCSGATWPTQAVSVSLGSSKVVTAPASPPMRPVRSSPAGVLDGARDAAPLGAGGTEPAMGVAEADLGLAFCREAREEDDSHGMHSSALHYLVKEAPTWGYMLLLTKTVLPYLVRRH